MSSGSNAVMHILRFCLVDSSRFCSELHEMTAVQSPQIINIVVGFTQLMHLASIHMLKTKTADACTLERNERDPSLSISAVLNGGFCALSGCTFREKMFWTDICIAFKPIIQFSIKRISICISRIRFQLLGTKWAHQYIPVGDFCPTPMSFSPVVMPLTRNWLCVVRARARACVCACVCVCVCGSKRRRDDSTCSAVWHWVVLLRMLGEIHEIIRSSQCSLPQQFDSDNRETVQSCWPILPGLVCCLTSWTTFTHRLLKSRST